MVKQKDQPIKVSLFFVLESLISQCRWFLGGWLKGWWKGYTFRFGLRGLLKCPLWQNSFEEACVCRFQALQGFGLVHLFCPDLKLFQGGVK